jgi:hypothetical protein
MFFFFRKKVIEIIAFIDNVHLDTIELASIKPANEILPEWWKKVPSGHFNFEKFEPSITVKNCPGIIKAITAGYILPLWTEVAVEYNTENYKINTSMRSKIEKIETDYIHTDENYAGFRLTSPWFLKSPVSLLYVDPLYHFDKPRNYKLNYKYAKPESGYVSTDVDIFYGRPVENTRDLIKYKTPIMQIIPQTEEHIKFRIEPADSSKIIKINSICHTSDNFSR